MKRIMVMGVGNLLLRDEGVGVHVIRLLETMNLPPEIELVDGGTHTYDLLDFFSEADLCFVIDAMEAGGEPGTVYRAPLEELGLEPKRDLQSLHDLQFAEAMEMLRLMGHSPQVVVYGVQPHTIELGLELTPVVAEQVPRVAAMIQEEINSLFNN
ncbi:MAG TPA: HyaD/HybD family hydrogenase maturation endopeptidase [Syntrophomonadaceae bacterium]|nr:HyaD/HybD family hydrogenase maturation endopeptidase [Syntrophomonadaceae bacterium]